MLHIFLTNPINKGKAIDVVVYFSTNEKQTAASWVPTENTLDKHFDFMYTQCQPCHCRSLVPMQDSPSMKFTYDVHVVTGRSYISYVSGNKTKEVINDKRNTFFNMNIPIAGYLMAIVSGDLKER
jgi:leukotriene-A4 hydrolase